MPQSYTISPIRRFLDIFLPSNPKLPPNYPDIFSKAPHSGKALDAESMCIDLNRWCSSMQLAYRMAATSMLRGPEPSFYVSEETSLLYQDRIRDYLSTTRRGASYDANGCVVWPWVVSVIDAENDTENSQDDDSADEAERCQKRSVPSLAAMLEKQGHHMRRIFKYQHRRHVQGIIVLGRRARFTHWDHAGIVVSEDFEFYNEPALLTEFFHRLLHGGKVTQGYDCTVMEADAVYVDKLRQYSPKEEHSDTAKAELLEAKQDVLGATEIDRILYPIQCVKYPDVPSRDLRISSPLRTYAYLIGKPRSTSRNVVGSGTRGYIAYDVDHDELVFLKDCWRNGGAEAALELDIYEAFVKTGVGCVATALAGGDVEAQATTSHGAYLQPDAEAEIRYHYRVILKEIGRPLWLFRDTRELASAMNDALTGHCDAYEKAKILHRNITPENIIIDIVTGRGLLIDWDHCISRDLLCSQSGHVGTWPYMSAALCRWPLKPNTIADDLESFLWSLVLPVLRYLVHSRSAGYLIDGKFVLDETRRSTSIASYVEATFHSAYHIEGYVFGGMEKYDELLRVNGLSWKLSMNYNGPLATLINRLHGLFHEFYLSIDEDAMVEQYSAPGVHYAPSNWRQNNDFRQPTGCLDNHSRMRTIFAEVLGNPSCAWTDERTLDQLAYALPQFYSESSDFYGVEERAPKRPGASRSEIYRATKRARIESGLGVFNQEDDEAILGHPRR